MSCSNYDLKIYADLFTNLGKDIDNTKATELAGRICGNLGDLGDSVDASFILANAYLVFFMQVGFAMLCAGSLRSKNCMNILLKNVLDACFGAPVFYLVGWGFAYGKGNGSHNGFIGNDDFALHDLVTEGGSSHHMFLFQWAFAAATATIVSGSVAERCSFEGYIAYSVFLTGFVYPTVVHWVWSDTGWLSPFKSTDLFLDVGMMDYAGSGVVHMTGGIAGLMGAAIIGPRFGRFDQFGKPSPGFGGHSVTLVVMGTFFLWFGWYGFNVGSGLSILGDKQVLVAGRVAVTTTLGGATGGISSLFLNRILTGHYDLSQVCNGILCGLVSVTAGCAVIEPAAAILVAAIAPLIFDAGCRGLIYFKIDDPLLAAPMHGACGMWAVLYVGLMAKPDYCEQVYGSVNTQYGVFYGGDGTLLGAQVVGILAITAWVVGLLGPFFYGLRKLGILRVPPEDEAVGLDISHHGGSAYTLDQQENVDSSKPAPIPSNAITPINV